MGHNSGQLKSGPQFGTVEAPTERAEAPAERWPQQFGTVEAPTERAKAPAERGPQQFGAADAPAERGTQQFGAAEVPVERGSQQFGAARLTYRLTDGHDSGHSRHRLTDGHGWGAVRKEGSRSGGSSGTYGFPDGRNICHGIDRD